MDQCGSANYTKNTKAKIVTTSVVTIKIQVLGLLAHLSSYITIFILNAY